MSQEKTDARIQLGCTIGSFIFLALLFGSAIYYGGPQFVAQALLLLLSGVIVGGLTWLCKPKKP